MRGHPSSSTVGTAVNLLLEHGERRPQCKGPAAGSHTGPSHAEQAEVACPFTAQVYAHVLPPLGEQAATAFASVVADVR